MATLNRSAQGDSGNNTIYGTSGADSIAGNAGSDSIYGGDGGDFLNGNTGDDLIFGGNGNDTLNGGGDNDALFGGNGNDRLSGGLGDDALDGGAGLDILSGGAGFDTFMFDRATLDAVDRITDIEAGETLRLLDFSGSISWTIDAATQDVTLFDQGQVFVVLESAATLIDQINFEFIYSLLPAPADDPMHLSGNAQANTLIGGTGNDTAAGNGGNDLIYGLEGDDHLMGGIGNDELYGGAGNDKLMGGQHDDVLFGGGGDDLLSGDRGLDQLRGGEGHDTFVFKRIMSHETDVILDFQAGETIRLQGFGGPASMTVSAGDILLSVDGRVIAELDGAAGLEASIVFDVA